MKQFILEDEKWEESVKYYYTLKSEVENKKSFIIDVLGREGINHSSDSFEVLPLDLFIKVGDFIQFCDCIKLNNSKVNSIESIINDWDFKAFFIDFDEYFVLRIWETTA